MTKKKVALFQSLESNDWQPVFWADEKYTDERADKSQPDGYVRISPYMTIEFQSLEPGPIVEKSLEQLAKAEQNIREEFQRRLDQINDTRQKLLALPFRPAA